ncbi:MAG: lysophospholipid acyltransferase family protein, partial [Myxococcota bacterium]|nr:lysophospholipid acyltransferase family protein [Myxococcota bacterium]
DFFVVSWVTFNKTNLPKRIFFPVRSTFFYDNWLGIPFSFFMGGYSMFPPIMRGKEKRSFNRYSMQRMVAELKLKGTIVGFHPEGTRNKSEDLYSLLPPKPGAGELYRKAPHATILPIYIRGITNNLLHEFWFNWSIPKQKPIDVYFAPPPDCSDLLQQPPSRELHLQIAQRCMDQIQAQIDIHRNKQHKSTL